MIATYDNRDAFYAAHPDLAQGWDLANAPGEAALGSDIHSDNERLITVAHPERESLSPDPRGACVVLERATDRIGVLAGDITVSEALRQYGESK